MAFYDEVIDRILAVIDEDRKKNLSFLIYRDVGTILDNMIDRYCDGCDLVTHCDQCEYKEKYEEEEDDD